MLRKRYVFYQKSKLKNYFLNINKDIHMPFVLYVHQSRQEQNGLYRFGGLFVTFPKSQIILFTISLLFTRSPPNFLA